MYVAKRKFVIKYGNEGHYITRIDAPWYSRPYAIHRQGVFTARAFTRWGAERYVVKRENLRGW